MSEYIFGPDINNENNVVVVDTAPYLTPVWGESPVHLNIRILTLGKAITPDPLLPHGTLADIFTYGEPQEPWQHSRVEVDTFTRSQAFTHPDNPGKVYYFTGLNYGTERDDELVLIRPGIDQVGHIGDIYMLQRLTGSVSSGAGQTLYTQADGTQVREHSDSPLGAYIKDELTEKIKNTARASKMWGRYAHIPVFRGMVEYSDSTNDSAGAVYTLPLNVSPIQLASIELMKYRFESAETSPYLLFAWQSGRFLRMMHNKGYAHNQYHTGNRAFSIADWQLCAKDFETMQRIAGHQNTEPHQALAGASPKQSVMELDLFTCVSNDVKTAIHIAKRERQGTIHVPLTAFLPEQLAYAQMHDIAIKVAAANILGYTNPTTNLTEEMHSRQVAQITRLIQQHSPALANPLLIKRDTDHFADGLATGVSTYNVRGEFPLKARRGKRGGKGKRKRRRRR